MQIKLTIANRANALLDGTIATLVSRMGPSSVPGPTEQVIGRRVLMLFLPLLLGLPVVLALYGGIALALPLGLAVTVALFLVTLLLALWSARMGAAGDRLVVVGEGSQAEAPEEDGVPHPAQDPQTLAEDLLCLVPGLILHLDGQARVIRMAGRDRSAFLPLLREPLGRPLIEQVHVTDRLAFGQALDGLRQGEARCQLMLRLAPTPLVPASTRLAVVMAQLTAQRAADGRLTGVVVQLADAARDQALVAQLGQLQAELAQANETKSRFLAAVSHELRTPLNAIMGFSDLLIGDYVGKLEDERHRDYLRLIRQSGGHLLAVVNTMLDMCRIEAGRYELLVE